MQENILKTMKVGAMLVLALSAATYSFQYGRSINREYPTKTFSVDGVGDVDTTPDVAKFSVSVITDGGKNVAEVQGANTEKMNKVTAFLKEQGIEKKDLKTAQYNLSPRYDYSCREGACPPPAIIGYTLSQSLDVKVRDTAKLGDLLSGVVQNGANNVSDIKFVVDDNDDAKNVARAKAIEKAKTKAKLIAKQGGFRLGKLVSLYDSNVTPQDNGGYGMGGGAEVNSMKAAVPPTVEPGSELTTVTVTLTYEIIN